jgi:ABC-2 type transport system ATP-binding protein
VASTEAGPPVEVRGLVKHYGELVAVDNIDMTVEPGDVFGYLGPNGAGKTTSLRMMLGLIAPSAGSVRLFGRNPHETVRALDGVAGFVEAPRFYPYLTGRKNLELVAAFDGNGAAGRIDAALDTVELADRAGDKVGGYSHGMRQRLGIAGALLRAPRLLLLDEPATGLDPAGMRDMRALISRLAGDGVTVLLSSHDMDEVEDLCDEVTIMRSGRVVFDGTMERLREQAPDPAYHLATSDDDKALVVAGSEIDVTRDGDELLVRARREQLDAYVIALGRADIAVRRLDLEFSALKALFFRLTEGDAHERAADPEVVR